MSIPYKIIDRWEQDAPFLPESARVTLQEIKSTNRVIELRMPRESLEKYKAEYTTLAPEDRYFHYHPEVVMTKARWVARKAKPKTAVVGCISHLAIISKYLTSIGRKHHGDRTKDFDLLLTTKPIKADHVVYLEPLLIKDFLAQKNSVMLVVHDTYDDINLSNYMREHEAKALFPLAVELAGEQFGAMIVRVAEETGMDPYKIRSLMEDGFRRSIMRKQLNLHCDPELFYRFEEKPWEVSYIPFEAMRRVMRGGDRAKEVAEAWGVTEAEVMAAAAQKLARKVVYFAPGMKSKDIIKSWARECQNPIAFAEALMINHKIQIPDHVKVPPHVEDPALGALADGLIDYVSKLVLNLDKQETQETAKEISGEKKKGQKAG